MNIRWAVMYGAATLGLLTSSTPTYAWDSEETYRTIQAAVSKFPGGGLPGGLVASIQPTHTSLTREAISLAAASFPEVATPVNQKALLDGANSEYHELSNTEKNNPTLPLRPYYTKLATEYGINPEPLRLAHKGSNSGCDDMPGWWNEAVAARRAGREKQAFYFLGVMLHMIQDMGVPAHGHGLKHQGNAIEFDSVELVATFTPYDIKTLLSTNFEDGVIIGFPPSTKYGRIIPPAITRVDPAYAEPWRYYDFSASWTRADAPTYSNVKTSFLFAPYGTWKNRIQLIVDRRTRTAKVCEWTLRSACKAFRSTTTTPIRPIRIIRP